MASEKQIKFFDELLGRKGFPEGTDKDALRQKFANVNDKSASAWIDRALELPDADETPVPF